MAYHPFRVRRLTEDGPKVVGHFQTIGKAATFASKRMRETGSVFKIERRPPMSFGWETATEFVPEVQSPIEAAIARGQRPKVQDTNGRKGQVLSYIRPTREVRVAWQGVEKAGKGEVMPVDQLSLR